MRANKLALVAALALLLPALSSGQSTYLPLGRPYTMAQGFGSNTAATLPFNVPTDAPVVVAPIPQQQVGPVFPALRKLMIFPNRNTVQGVSPLPPASNYSNSSLLNGFNLFGTK
jgi:hypothetical protein